MVREGKYQSSGGTLSSDDDIHTVPSRYNFENTGNSTLSSAELDYGNYTKLGGGHQQQQQVVVVASGTASASSLVTVEESTEVVAVCHEAKQAALMQTPPAGNKNIFRKLNMFRHHSPGKNKEDDEYKVDDDEAATTPQSRMAAASKSVVSEHPHQLYPSVRHRGGTPDNRSRSSSNNKVRRYKVDGTPLEEQAEIDDDEEEKEESLATVSLGDHLSNSSAGMYSALYSDFASEDRYSMVASTTDEDTLSAARESLDESDDGPSILQTEVDADSKQNSLDAHALYTACNQSNTPTSPVPPPSHFFQPVVRNVEDDDGSEDIRTLSPSMGLSSSFEVPSLDAEHGSSLSDGPRSAAERQGSLPPPMSTMAQRLFGGGLPTPVPALPVLAEKSTQIPPLKPSPTNSTGPPSSDEDDTGGTTPTHTTRTDSTPQRGSTKAARSSFLQVQEILKDPISAPHELSDGEGDSLAKIPSLEGKSFELFVHGNDTMNDDDKDEQQSSITSITNAMERGRTMANQATGGWLGQLRQSLEPIERIPAPKKEEEVARREPNDRSDNFCLAWVCLFLLLILGGLVAGVCGSGFCAKSKWQRTRPSTVPSLDDDILYNLPPDFFENSSTRGSDRPTPSPLRQVPPPVITQVPTKSPTTAQPFVSMPTFPVVIVPISFGSPQTEQPVGELGQTDVSGRLVLSSTADLYEAVDRYLSRPDANIPPINEWDVSRITDFSQVFSTYRNAAARTFNEDLTGWDTRNAVSMQQMFLATKSFNGDVSTFDTSNVKNMQEMFARAEGFNGDLAKWNTGSVENMRGLFRGARNFNRDISQWNTARVTDMTNMFLSSSSFNQNIGGWLTGKVTSMSGMFREAVSFNQDLVWETAQVQDMDAMFMAATKFNGLVSFKTAKVRSMNRMFYYAGSFEGKGVELWETGLVTTMDRMFNGARSFAGDVTNWDVSNVKIAEKMFAGAITFARNLCSWRTGITIEPTLTSSFDMFVGTACPRREDPEQTNSYSTICFPCRGASPPQIAPAVVLPSSGYRGQTFTSANELKAAVDAYLDDPSQGSPVAQLYGYPIGNWRVERITDFSNLFSANRNTDAVHFNESLENWDMTSAETTISMFEGAISFTGIGLPMWDTSSIVHMDRMFAYSGFKSDLSLWDVSNVKDFSRMFMFAHAFQSDLSWWNTANAEDMSFMFRGALVFSSDLSQWNVENVRTFEETFAGATTFSTDLCQWQGKIGKGALTNAMFVGSSCPETTDPTVSSAWCWICSR